MYKDSTKPINDRVKDLLSRLTLKEKVSLMVFDSKAVPRLDIKEYHWWNECLHGVARAGKATIFPQAIGLAATFNESIIFNIAEAISDEARAKYNENYKKGKTGRYRGLTFFSPNINIFRDPRWGRGQETYGEDPYLTSIMGKSFIKGLQGYSGKYLKTAACAKHYVAHSGPEHMRHYFDVKVTKKDLYETYLPAFKALIEQDVKMVMGSYNRLNGEACCASTKLLKDILRKELNFKGLVISDGWALWDLHEGHNITKNETESAAFALKNGCDFNLGNIFNYLTDAVNKGDVKEKYIDDALSKSLSILFELGIFDDHDKNPYSKISYEVVNCEKHRKLAYQSAVESIVLLKNKNSLLPIHKNLDDICVVGYNALNPEILLGNYYGVNDKLVTILEGLVSRGSSTTNFAYMCACLDITKSPNDLIWSFGEIKRADTAIVVLGINPLIEGEEGDAIKSKIKGDRDNISLPENQIEYIKKIAETETPIILILAGGCPISTIEVNNYVDAILQIWYPGEEGGNAVADIIFGNNVPSGRLPITVPVSIDQIPPFEDYNITGRTYRYMVEKPLYPFGFGLSYTKFKYSNLRLSKKEITDTEELTVEITVKNSGSLEADEVVQMYIKDVEASVQVPIYELKGFKKITIKPGENKILKFKISIDMLKIVNDEGNFVLEKGEFKVFIGGVSPGNWENLGVESPLEKSFYLI